ncbi:hypothetical protein E3E14_22075 [Streptomyces sp. ICN441]|uniref:Uncharacterized protein n=1 Tax=Streptomyces tirandamycinicus TaxID=2174846 RepID=A0A2S1T1J0_9ACTN|nr:hypothetical protein DDW44_29520 [Streptomyces tirandamycinicus]TFE43385.1 hypothetical protein E3E14_22075 [Streptomyces sp. ICN441]
MSSEGHSFLLVTLRMTVPSGRKWQQYRFIENHDLRSRLVPLLGTLPLSHSLLQEPHGGQPCRFSDPAVRLWQDDDSDRWPNTLYRSFAEADGPRRGLGEVTVTLRLHSRGGSVREVSRTVNECNVRADGQLLRTQVPDVLPLDG